MNDGKCSLFIRTSVSGRIVSMLQTSRNLLLPRVNLVKRGLPTFSSFLSFVIWVKNCSVGKKPTLRTLPLVSLPNDIWDWNEWRNSILMMCHYPGLGSASDWLNSISHTVRPIRSITQIWVVRRRQYGISAFLSQMSFGGEISGSVVKCRLFFQARKTVAWKKALNSA